MKEIEKIGLAQGGKLRRYYKDFPRISKTRYFQKLVARDESFNDFFWHVARTENYESKIQPSFAIVSGGPGTGKMRLLEEIAALLKMNKEDLEAFIRTPVN